MSKSLFDELLAGMGNAIADVREKVVEEGWFGRTVTDGPQTTPETTTQLAAPSAEAPGNAWQELVAASRNADTRDVIQPKEPDFDH